MRWMHSVTTATERCSAIIKPARSHTQRPPGPDPAGAIRLFTSLSTASLLEDRLPLDVTLVVGVHGVGDIQGLLEVLTGAGVKHRPLPDVSKLLLPPD